VSYQPWDFDELKVNRTQSVRGVGRDLRTWIVARVNNQSGLPFAGGLLDMCGL
jgi:hypothetical protein